MGGLIDIGRHVATLWRRRLVIVISVAAALSLAGVYLVATPPKYTAMATILIDTRQEQVVDANSVLSGIGTDSAAIASQVNVLESRGLLERVFASLNLAEDPEFRQPEMLAQVMATLRGRSATISTAAAFDEFRRRVSVQRLGLTYVLEIRFTSAHPDKAARLANAVVDEYLSGLTQDKSDANITVTRQLQSRIDTLRAALSSAELAVETFKVEHNILSAGAGSTVLQSQIDQLTSQVSVARGQARDALTRAEQARAALSAANGLSGMEDLLVSEAGAQLRGQYNQRAAELSNMQATMGPRHPSLVAAQAEIASLERLMKAEAQRASAQLDADAQLAEQNVARAESDLLTMATVLQEANRADVTLRQLERDADVARNLLEEFMRRALETSELGTMQNSEAKVLSQATEPRSAAWPKANLILALATALGAMAGCVVALLLGAPSTGTIMGSPSTPSPQFKKRRAPSFAQAGAGWQSLGALAPHAVSSARIRAAGFLDRTRNETSGCFVAGVSTLSSVAQRNEMTHSLARHYASMGVVTAVIDLDPSEVSLATLGDRGVEVLSSFTGDTIPPGWPLPGLYGVILDDNQHGKPQLSALLTTIEGLRHHGGFELLLVNAPRHDERRWGSVLATQLDAEVVIVRTEELVAYHIDERQAGNHPVAYLTLAAVPSLVQTHGPVARARREEA